MKSAQLAALCLAAGSVLGSAVGFWLGGSRESVSAAGVSAAGVSAAGAAPSVGQTADPSTSPSGGPVAALAEVSCTSRAPSATEVAEREARRLSERVAAGLAAIPVDTSDWTGEITGWVLDEDGQPISGAVVSSRNADRTPRRTVQLESPAHLGMGFEEQEALQDAMGELESAVALRLRDAADRAAATRTAKADAAGKFRLTGLREGSHQLDAHAEDFVFSPEFTEVGATAEFVGVAIKTIELDLRLPDGSQPETGAVAVIKDDRPTPYSWSPEEPGLRVTESTLEVKVYGGSLESIGYRNLIGEFESDRFVIDLDEEAGTRRLVELHPARLLRVHVKDTSATRPRLRPWVRLQLKTDETPDWAAGRVQPLPNATPDQFVAKDLAAGVYVVAIGRGESKVPETTREVLVELGEVSVEVTLGELDMSEMLVVRCVSAGGRPVKGVQFILRESRFKDGNFRGQSSRSVRPQPRQLGVYWIQESALLRGKVWNETSRYALEAISDKLGSIESPIDGSSGDLTMTFEQPCDLTVTVAGTDGRPYEVAVAPVQEIGPGMEDSAGPFRSYSDLQKRHIGPSSSALFRGLQPGKYEVILMEIRVRGREQRQFRLASVTLDGPSMEVRAEVPSLHTVQVFAPRASASADFRLVPEGVSSDDMKFAISGFLDKEQRCTFERVPAGAYTLLSRRHHGHEVQVTVPTGEVLFETSAPNALRVTAVSPGRAAALAGLKVGDFITHVDGKPPLGRSASSLLAAKIAATEVQLMVLRGGSAITVTLGPAGETEGGAPDTGFSTRRHYLPN